MPFVFGAFRVVLVVVNAFDDGDDDDDDEGEDCGVGGSFCVSKKQDSRFVSFRAFKGKYEIPPFRISTSTSPKVTQTFVIFRSRSSNHKKQKRG